MKIKLIKFKSVKSTNDIAIKFIKKNKLLSAIVTSKKQIKGRGTMGKKWVSKKGNLFFSIFFEIKEKKINFKQYAVLNALVLRKLISEFISKRISIKWPNDLIFKKKKICGILQETIIYNQKKFLIIGVGLNTNLSPNNKSFLSTCLQNIIDTKINNDKILRKIKTKYENFLGETKKFTYLSLKRKYR